MTMLFTLLLVALGILWVWMLIDSFRRTEFPTPIGNEAITRWYWRLALLLVNPITVLAYALMVKWRIRALGTATLHRALSVALGALAVILQWGLFGTATSSVFAVSGKVSSLGSSHSRMDYSGQNPLSPTPMRRIRVLAFSDHPVIENARARLAERLRRMPFVTDVVTETLDATDPRPANPVSDNRRAADFEIALSLQADRDWILPGCQLFDATIKAEARAAVGPRSSRRVHRHAKVDLNVIEIDLDLTVRFRRYGCALGNALYGEIAAALDKAFGEHLEQKLHEAHAAGGTAPELPPALAPRPAPEIAAFSARDAHLLRLEHDWFIHTRAHYVIPTTDPSTKVFEQLAEDLATDGWKRGYTQGKGDRQWTEFSRGEEYLEVGRWPLPESQTMQRLVSFADGKPVVTEPPAPRHPEVPIHAVYKKHFTRGDVEAVAAEVAARGAAADMATAIMLQRHFDKEQRKALRQTIAGRSTGTPETIVERDRILAEQAHKDGELDEAKVLLRRAHALMRVSRTRSQKKKIEKLAQKLEISLEAPEAGALPDLGLTRLPMDQATTLTLGLGETRTLLAQPKEGSPLLVVISPRSLEAGRLILRVDVHRDGGASSQHRPLKLEPAAEGQPRPLQRGLISLMGHWLTVNGTVASDDKQVVLQLTLKSSN